MNRIAVTGASGFVGRSLVSRLRRDGFQVLAMTRGKPSDTSCTGLIYCVNYRDASLLARLFTGIDVVIHLAARAHVASEVNSVGTLELYRSANVACLVSIAQAARNACVRRVLFVSSIGVNGSFTKGKPFTEADIPAPSEPYALSKLEAELALAVQLADGPTDWVILRPTLVYGPGCPGNLARLIRLASSSPILPFRALHSRRTMLSLDNFLDALLIAAVHPAVSRRTFVVSDDHDIDVSGILEAFLQGLGRGGWRLLSVPPFLIGLFFQLFGKKILWQKFSGELLVDSSAFQSATGWVPAVCPREGLRLAVSASAAPSDV